MGLEPREATNKDMNTENREKPLKIVFLGDLFLGGEFITTAKQDNCDLLRPLHLVSNNLADADILFVNLEGPIYSGLNKREDVTAIISNHAFVIEFLTKFKICVLNLANNHIMDYGTEGLNHTLCLLDNNKLDHVGAGCNYIEANKELIIDCDNRKVAFAAYTTDEIHVKSIIARDDSPGCATYLDLDKVVSRIHDLKSKADVVCVSLHWGHEYYQYPSPSQIIIAHSLADAGADYVIGHHPHVIQGIENYNNSLIMYSLGNFFFSPFRSTSGRLQYQKPLTKEFMIVCSDYSESETIGYDLFGGTVNEDYCLVPFDGDDQQRFIQKESSLSRPITDPAYSKFWEEYRVMREHELLSDNLIEAFRKLFRMSLKDIASTVGPGDIKRNIRRFYEILFKSR